MYPPGGTPQLWQHYWSDIPKFIFFIPRYCTVISFLVLILITIDFIHVFNEYQNSNFDIFGKQTFLLPLYFKPRTYYSFGILTTYNLLAPLYAYFKPIRLLNFQKLLSYTLIPSYTIIRQRRVLVTTQKTHKNRVFEHFSRCHSSVTVQL